MLNKLKFSVLKNTIKFVFFFMFLNLFLLLTSYNTALAESSQLLSFIDPKFQMSLSYPDSYVITPKEDLGDMGKQIPLVILAKHATKPLNFNILAIAGQYDIERDVDKQSEEILKSYKKNGIIDVSAHSPAIVKIKDRSAFCLELHYITNQIPTLSFVAVIPDKDKHFILTFISTEKNTSDTLKEDFNTVLQSISLPKPVKKEEIKVKAVSESSLASSTSDSTNDFADNTRNNPRIFLVILAILAFISFLSFRKK